ncbi:hypothetical protein IDM40_10810 [Nocardiopsis sp. HNM0947]|uniref:Uncharacterized protein n=1 Tax=Nocardiopsis coralli TaxID=2772213 RepID=A0ABR9P5R0_9ACTN|nr:hypothetical protein [Nocardiopsis coralli]MBE2999190.1 hypothetical protein [Nocardiopsis coralli]
MALGILPGSAGNTDCGSVFNPAYNLEPSFGDWMFGNPARDACVELHNGLRTPMLVLLIVGGAATVVGGIVKAYRNNSS